MTFDLRDGLIVLNIVSMIGGAFYLVGMLKSEITHLATAIDRLREWLERVDSRLTSVSERVAIVEADRRNDRANQGGVAPHGQ